MKRCLFLTKLFWLYFRCWQNPLQPKKIKYLIQERNNVYKSYRNSKNSNNMQHLGRLKLLLQEDLYNATEIFKLNCYSWITHKLTPTRKNAKVYCVLLNSFFNNKKIPLIPALFHGNEYLTDFKKKAELFKYSFEK